MYRKYYNEYEKKAEQIRRDTTDNIRLQPSPAYESTIANPSTDKNILSIFSNDDIILLFVIIMLLQNENTDTMLLITLGYLFLSGF